MTRVAVQVGAAWLRVAAEGRLLAEIPVAELPAGATSLSSVLDGLFDAELDELVVVQPAVSPPARQPPPWASLPAGTVRTVSGAVAALAQQVASDGAGVDGAWSDGAGPDGLGSTGTWSHGVGSSGTWSDGVGSTGTWSAGAGWSGAAPVHAVVVDVGHTGTEIARVAAARVVAARWVAVGGARLDAVTAAVTARARATADPGGASGVHPAADLPGIACRREGRPDWEARHPREARHLGEARRVREALSLLPVVRTGAPPVLVTADDVRAALSVPLSAVVRAVRDVVGEAAPAGRSPPVLLVGGVARTPLLAELLDEAGVGDVHVADRPDAAAVLGALRVPGAPVAAGPTSGRPAPPITWLPPVAPARYRRARVALATLAVVAGVAGLTAAGAALPAATSVPAAASAGDLAQYGYAVRLPAGWAHTGGLPERRRSLLTPAAAPEGTDLISVERTPLGYDADAEPERARAELRARFVAAVGSGAPLSAFADDARFAGRPVVSYREAGGVAGDVDWYVVLDGDAQLSVGCRHTPAGAAAVGAACATVVGSVHRTA